MAITISQAPVQMLWTGVLLVMVVVLVGWVFPPLINQDNLLVCAQIHFGLGVATLITTSFMKTPYGKHSRDSGPLVPVLSARLAWILQESPTLIAVGYSVVKQIEAGRRGVMIELEYDDSWIDDITGWFHPALSLLSSPTRLFCMHYVHRCLIFPFNFNSGNGSPLYVVSIATLYCCFNGCLQVQAAQTVRGVMRPQSLMDLNEVQYPLGLAGVVLFLGGMYINISADYALIALRGGTQAVTPTASSTAVKTKAGGRGTHAVPAALARKAAEASASMGSTSAMVQASATTQSLGDRRYKIPTGFWVYNYVSCPNYLGEFLEWCGYALVVSAFSFTDFDKEAMSFGDYLVTPWLALFGLAEANKATGPTLVAFSFAFYTLCNTFPRAFATHQWYLDTFGEEYKKLNRKAVIPFLL